MKTPAKLRIVPFFCIIFSSIEVSALPPTQPPEKTVTLNNTNYGHPTGSPYTTQVPSDTLLLDILNKAAGEDKDGPFNKYESIYYGGSYEGVKLGYFITAMGGVKSTNNTYWMIIDDQTGACTPCGVSSYVPGNGSIVIFNFTSLPCTKYQNSSEYCKQAPSSGQVPPSPITVTIELYWDVESVGKPIPASYTTQVTDGTVLLDIINKAADEDTKGPFNKYASTYYGGLGYFITAFNGTKQDPATGTYWMIYDKKTGKQLEVGVSQYKPNDGSVTVFKLGKQETTTVASSMGNLGLPMTCKAYLIVTVIMRTILCW